MRRRVTQPVIFQSNAGPAICWSAVSIISHNIGAPIIMSTAYSGGRGAGVPLVERAAEFKFIIDMKSATALRISSQSTLMQATRMIE